MEDMPFIGREWRVHHNTVDVAHFCWYDLKCDGEGDPTDLQANFGLIDYAAQAPRPSFLAYSRIAKTFGAISDFVPLDIAPSFSVHPEAVKSMAWQRLSDGAILVAFWRLDQVIAAANDFDAQLTLALPSGFQADGVDVVDLHPDTLTAAPFTVADNHAISVPVRVTTRAAWIVIHPRSPHGIAFDAKWSEGLPAACAASGEAGKARFELTGPRQAPSDAPVPLVLTVDNTAGTTGIAGFINLSGRETQFAVPSGETTHVDLSLPVAKGGNARVSWYTIRVGDRMVGRGGFTVFDEAPAPSIPTAKDR